MVLSIWDNLNKFSDSVRDFLIDQGRNPIIWIGLFVLGLLVFFVTYNALHKN